MKKTLVAIGTIMTVFALISLCAVGTWSAWYPWPPTEAGVENDIQNAVWITWFWAVLVPTFVVDVFIAWFGVAIKKWWD